MRWFKKPPETGLEHRLQLLQHWLHAGAGEGLWQSERVCIEHELHYIFGYHACQMTVDPQSRLLEACQVGQKFLLSPFETQSSGRDDNDPVMVTDPYNWPIYPGSLDFVLLHHALEISERPHRLLSEAGNTIIPGGKLMIVGFNPWSLLNLSRWVMPSQRRAFQGVRLISPVRMRDWLTLLGFNVERNHYGAYHFPMNRLGKGVTGELMEQHCKNWRLPMGSFYVMLATREVHGMTPVKRAWPEMGRSFVTNPIAGSSAGRMGENS